MTDKQGCLSGRQAYNSIIGPMRRRHQSVGKADLIRPFRIVDDPTASGQ
jgi:hypothetical protein